MVTATRPKARFGAAKGRKPRRIVIKWRRPYLYPLQEAAIFAPTRYSIIEASTKSGKTVGCIVWLTEQALKGKAGYEYWWVAPIVGQAKIAFRRVCRFLSSRVYTVNKTELTITLLNGAVLRFKSADNPDSLYGEDVYAVVIDEATRCKEESYHAVRSTLTATRGPIRIIGNVKGRRNWVYRLAARARSGDDPNMSYHKITAYDAVAAGVLDGQEIEDAKAALPENVFRELYLAEPSEDSGNPFGIEAIQRCIAPIANTPARVFGWDLAKSVDYNVGVGLDHDGRICVFERWNGVPWRITIDRIDTINGNVSALVDSTGVGDPILEDLQALRGVSVYQGYTFTQASKQKLMEGLALAIQKQYITVIEGVLLDELEIFEYSFSRTGGVRYCAPEGYHDDCVMGLALAQMQRTLAPSQGVYL